MKLQQGYLLLVALVAFAGCGRGTESDTDGDGKVSAEERAQQLPQDGYMSIQPGRWKMEFKFTEIDVPKLGEKQKQDILRKLESSTSGLSCLSAEEAAKPGPDFFGGKGAEDCTYKQFDLAGNRAQMRVTCGMGDLGKADLDLDGTVGDTQIDFATKFVISAPIVGKIKLSGTMTGTHDGKCKGNE